MAVVMAVFLCWGVVLHVSSLLCAIGAVRKVFSLPVRGLSTVLFFVFLSLLIIVVIIKISVLGRMAVTMAAFLCWGAVLRVHSLFCVVRSGKGTVLAGQVPLNFLVFCLLSFPIVVVIGISVLGRRAVPMVVFLLWGAVLHVDYLLCVVGAAKDVVLASQVPFNCLLVNVIIFHPPFLSHLVFSMAIS